MQTTQELNVPLPDGPFPAELEESLEGFIYTDDTFPAAKFDEVNHNLPFQFAKVTTSPQSSAYKCLQYSTGT